MPITDQPYSLDSFFSLAVSPSFSCCPPLELLRHHDEKRNPRRDAGAYLNAPCDPALKVGLADVAAMRQIALPVTPWFLAAIRDGEEVYRLLHAPFQALDGLFIICCIL